MLSQHDVKNLNPGDLIYCVEIVRRHNKTTITKCRIRSIINSIVAIEFPDYSQVTYHLDSLSKLKKDYAWAKSPEDAEREAVHLMYNMWQDALNFTRSEIQMNEEHVAFLKKKEAAFKENMDKLRSNLY